MVESAVDYQREPGEFQGEKLISKCYKMSFLLPSVLGEIVVLVYFWKTINVHYAGGLGILANGDRMAVKEERALADGILTPFCVFLFGGGRVGGSYKLP